MTTMSRKNRNRARHNGQVNHQGAVDIPDEDIEIIAPEDEVIVDSGSGITGDEEGDPLHAIAGDISVYDEQEEEEEEEQAEDPYAVLQRQFNEANSARQAAEAQRDNERRRAQELEAEKNALQGNELYQHRVLIEHALAAAKSEKEEARRVYRMARETGDIEAELAAQDSMSEVDFKFRQLTAGHAEVSRRLDEQKNRPAPATQAVDPVDHYIATNFPNPRDQAWLRKNKADIFGNEDRQELALAGHKTATLRHKIQPGTDEYYAFMDDHMGYGDDSQQQEPPARERAAQARSTVVAKVKPKAALSAPVSRAGAAGVANVERASAAEKSLARDLGMTVSEYRANQALIEAGKTHHRYS